MGCPIYRTEGSAHGEIVCPLRNGNRDQKGPSPAHNTPGPNCPDPMSNKTSVKEVRVGFWNVRRTGAPWMWSCRGRRS